MITQTAYGDQVNIKEPEIDSVQYVVTKGRIVNICSIYNQQSEFKLFDM